MGERTKKSIKNMYTGLLFRVGTLLLNFASRYFFIKFLGDACLGLNGLFTTILSLFSLADLGVGEAITYYLYKPIAERNEEKLRQLIHFYKLCYRVIGCVVLGIGLLLIPFLPRLINLETESGYNNYVVYLLYLANTVITYLFFSYPRTVLTANQEQYIVNNNATLFWLIMFLGDVLALALTRNYLVYLSLRLTVQIIQNVRLYVIAKRKYSYVSVAPKSFLDKGSLKKMFHDVYSVFIVKLSSQLIESTDNIFISVFLGTVLVGYNSNYLMFYSAALGIITTIMYSFSAGVGDLVATESIERRIEVFHQLDSINFTLSFFCSICLFSFLNPFITILWGASRTFSVLTVILMSFNFFMVTGLNTIFVFRQSMGLFKYYAYNTLYTAISNIILDFLFVKKLGVMGLYLATVISNLVFGVWPFIRNVFEIGFQTEAKSQIIKTLGRFIYVVLFYGATCAATCFLQDTIGQFCLRVIITLFVIVAGIVIYALMDSRFKNIMLGYLKQLIGKITNES